MSANYDGLEKHIKDRHMRKKFHKLPNRKKKVLVKQVKSKQRKNNLAKILFWIVVAIAVYVLFLR